MSLKMGQRIRYVGLSLALSAAGLVPIAFAQPEEVDILKRGLRLQNEQLRMPEARKLHDFLSIRVNPGSEAAAKQYYADIAALINFKTLPTSDLSELLAYLGFEGLQAADLELLDSEILMPKSKTDFDQLASQVVDPATFKSKRSLGDFAKDRVLVSRFFAPKIVNFDAKPNSECPVAKPDCKQNPYAAGWRKLVRLVPVVGSAADKGNIREAYILFNHFQPDVEKSPFPAKSEGIKPETQSVNNQIILVPKSHKSNEDAAFWIVYQPNSAGYKLGYALNAAFDVVQPGTGQTKDYFVPEACAQCHGHDVEIGIINPAPARPFPFAKTNYLDTDQWYDMLDFDFPGTKNSKFEADVIYDGGKDHKAKKYAAAVAVIAKINQHILKQNEESLRPDKSDQFKVLAAKKWLELHKANLQPIPPFKRSVGAKQWSEKKSPDATLLPLLDRFCFRCHSTVRFDVFDRQAMKGEAFLASIFVNNGFMPQGRILNQQQRDDLIKLLQELSAEK